MDAAYKGRENVYLFTWEGHKIAMVSVKDSSNKPKASKMGENLFLTISSFENEFELEVKEDLKNSRGSSSSFH